jgi:hypothetical protein
MDSDTQSALRARNPLLARVLEVPPAGLEPATVGLEVRCSIQLSYRGPLRCSDTTIVLVALGLR